MITARPISAEIGKLAPMNGLFENVLPCWYAALLDKGERPRVVRYANIIANAEASCELDPDQSDQTPDSHGMRVRSFGGRRIKSSLLALCARRVG
jgi:hypothetical protein